MDIEAEERIMIRIGQGYDVHQLVENRKLILGGVEIPHTKGLLGHSDADVLLHAIIDSLLGALALGDIGNWFPDNDKKYKNANSMELLREVINSSEFKDWEIANVDCTIMAQQPKLSPYIEKMREEIAKTLGVTVNRVSVKATTTEYLGFCGREEGIAASAIVLITNTSV